MTDKIDLENDDLAIISELMNEPATAKELKTGISNPSTRLKRLEKLGFVKKDKWNYEGKYYKPNIPKLLKAGILTKEKHGYGQYLGTYKHHFQLGFDSPTEKGFSSLFKGLDEIKEKDWKLWKLIIQIKVKALYHYFVETEDGFLTNEDAWKKRIERMEFDKKAMELLEKE